MQLRVNVYKVTCFPRITASRFADINSVKKFIEDPENENKERKLNRIKEYV